MNYICMLLKRQTHIMNQKTVLIKGDMMKSPSVHCNDLEWSEDSFWTGLIL